MEVLHISEFSNTKFSIFSWFFRHPNRPNYISVTFPNLFLKLSRIFFYLTFPLSEQCSEPLQGCSIQQIASVIGFFG